MRPLSVAGLVLLGVVAGSCGRDAETPPPQGKASSAATPPEVAETAAACASREEVWQTARRANDSYPADLPRFEAIGDCWVAVGDLERARAWLRNVKAFGSIVCDAEGVPCQVRASEELRRIDCGAGWLAPTAEAAWQDFLSALDQDGGAPLSRHVAPDVRGGLAAGDALAETCPSSAFDLPKSVLMDRALVRRRITSSESPWVDRSVSISIRPEDVPWKNYSPGVYRVFRFRACPTTRPVPGAMKPGFFIEIAPVESERFDPPCGSR